MTDKGSEYVRIKVWDWPTRLTHWALVILMVLVWWSVDVKEDLDLHKLIGLIILGLLVFRLYWGFFGSTPSLFVNFVKSPKAAVAYAKKLITEPAEISPGHTPLGGYSVVLMMALIIFQLVLGLFTIDIDYMSPGPLSFLLDSDTSLLLGEIHAKNFYVILGVITLHLAAVVFYVFVKRNNIVAAMVGGWKRFPKEGAPTLAYGSPVRLIVGIVLSVAVCVVIANAETWFAGMLG